MSHRVMRAIGITESLTIADELSYYRTPFGVLDSLPTLLDRTSKVVNGEGVIVLDQSALDQLCWNKPLTFGVDGRDPGLEDVRRAGWDVDHLAEWTTFRSRTLPRKSLHVCFLPTVTNPPFGVTDMFELVYRLAQYHATVGIAYRGNPAITGTALYRDVFEVKSNRKHKPMYRWDAAPRVRCEEPLVWRRPPTADESTHAYVHSYDAQGAYLSAAINAELPVDPLTNTGPCAFNPKVGGYWRIPSGWWSNDLFPDPAQLAAHPGRDSVWVTTPTIVMLSELWGHNPEILDSWTAPSARLLRPWGEHLRDALLSARQNPTDSDQKAIATAVKHTVTHALGLMARPGGRVYRPDWYHTVRAVAKANLCRKMWRAWKDEGRLPIQVKTDCVWYSSALPDAQKACPAAFPPGEGMGNFKINSSHLISEYVSENPL